MTPKTVLTANLPPAVAVPVAKIPAAATAVVQQVVMSVPEAQVEVQDTATKVVTTALQTLALSPFASSDPAAPVPDSPVMWAMLAMARKRPELEVPSSFGRMFDGLEPLNQQTEEQLRALAQGMQEVQATDNPKGTAAGITFFGQFIDHDLTLDTLPQPDSSVDPTTLVNGRTFAFDLDSVYGGGPTVSSQLYDGDKFKLGVATTASPQTCRATPKPARRSWWSRATTRT